jgi:hyperosmotically inducible protein
LIYGIQSDKLRFEVSEAQLFGAWRRSFTHKLLSYYFRHAPNNWASDTATSFEFVLGFDLSNFITTGFRMNCGMLGKNSLIKNINTMFKNKFKITFFSVLVSVVCFGCSGTSESNSAKISNGNQSTAALNKTANLPATPATAANSNLPAANNQTVNNTGAKTQPAANQPAPKIGSGGDDFSLFMQVRNSYNSDPEIINGVIVEIKEGNVTLSGKVPSEEKKKKAEQLAKNINGIKSVKNNITVSK